MFKTDSFLGNNKLSLNQNVWRDTAIMQQDGFFSLSTPTFLLSTPVENSEAAWKKATKCNKHFFTNLDQIPIRIIVCNS